MFVNCEKEYKSAKRPKELEGEGVAEWLTVTQEPKYEVVDGIYCRTCGQRSSCK